MKKYFILIVLSVYIFGGCTESIEFEPTDSISSEVAFKDAKGALYALYGCYDELQDADVLGFRAYAIGDVITNDLDHTGSFDTWARFDRLTWDGEIGETTEYWADSYDVINNVNQVLEHVPGIDMDSDDKDQILAEALFIRAYTHFLLVNYFGDIPYVTRPTIAPIDESYNVSRDPVATVYTNIVVDLADAATMFGNKAPISSTRAHIWAVRALQARVALYQGEYQDAANYATQVINEYPALTQAPASYVNNVDNDAEVILGLKFTASDQNGSPFWYTAAAFGGREEFTISDDFVNAVEPGDLRFDAFTYPSGGSFYVAKYNDVVDYDNPFMILKLGEMYLIRAEALLNGATVAGETALTDINAVRSRAGLGGLAAVTMDDIMQERRVELCFEGHRWFDLVRTGNALTEITGLQAFQQLMPIPISQTDTNPNMTQNPGY